MLNIGQEQQVQIRGADGSILWTGGVAIAASYIAISSEPTYGIRLGEAVVWDGSTAALGFLPRLETTAAGGTPAADLPQTLAMYCRRINGATDGPYLGVAMDPGGPGKRLVVAGVGSLTTVQVSLTAIALAAAVGSGVAATSTTPGLIIANATAGQVLGTCFKINTNAASGTGSAATPWFAGVLVSPR